MVSSPRSEGLVLQLSSSEELDVLSIDAGYVEDSPPHSPAYEELVEVITLAVAMLNINWPAKRQDVHPKRKLDKRFLTVKSQPPCQGLPFFPDLLTKVSRLWQKPFSARLYSPQVTNYSNVKGAERALVWSDAQSGTDTCELSVP